MLTIVALVVSLVAVAKGAITFECGAYTDSACTTVDDTANLTFITQSLNTAVDSYTLGCTSGGGISVLVDCVDSNFVTQTYANEGCGSTDGALVIYGACTGILSSYTQCTCSGSAGGSAATATATIAAALGTVAAGML